MKDANADVEEEAIKDDKKWMMVVRGKRGRMEQTDRWPLMQWWSQYADYPSAGYSACRIQGEFTYILVSDKIETMTKEQMIQLRHHKVFYNFLCIKYGINRGQHIFSYQNQGLLHVSLKWFQLKELLITKTKA